MSGFELDGDNPLWVKGWGVYRDSPWHFAGIFSTREEAEQKRDTIGTDYKVAFGSRRLASDDFIEGSAEG